jgi:hypothetical protein
MGRNIAPQKPLERKMTHLPSFLDAGGSTAFRAGTLLTIVTIRTVFTDVFDKPIRSEETFAVRFPKGQLGRDYPVERTPLNVEKMASMNRPYPEDE